MPAPQAPISRETFADWVHDALNHLYDSPYLQAHPLAEALIEEEPVSLPSSQQLRRVLLDAIQAMRPEAGIPAQSADWRGYRLLELRYIEGLTPTEAMNQLALGKSQFFREQARVLETLTALLWERRLAPASPAATASEAVREKLALSEVERLSTQATWEPVDVIQLLNELRAVIEPLAKLKKVALRFAALAPLTVSRGDRVMLRQVILSVITRALDLAQAGQVEVGRADTATETGIYILARAGCGDAPDADAQLENVGLDIGRQFMAEMGGMFQLTAPAPCAWEVRLTWPQASSPVLLVIDDNQDFVDLFRRYLAAGNWRVLGAADGAAARQIIAETRPTVIILDVMMPKEDGWEFLMSAKADAAFRDIPILICSVLNEPQLATTLGAVGYLPKPVTQPALLQALAPWTPTSASSEPAH
jgi:CheY-like chemotaxis protein